MCLYKCKKQQTSVKKKPQRNSERNLHTHTLNHTTLSHTSHTTRNVKRFHSESLSKKGFFLF